MHGRYRRGNALRRFWRPPTRDVSGAGPLRPSAAGDQRRRELGLPNFDGPVAEGDELVCGVSVVDGHGEKWQATRRMDVVDFFELVSLGRAPEDLSKCSPMVTGLRCTPTRGWYAAVGEGRAPVRYEGKGTRDIDLYVRRWSESPDAVDDLIIHVPGKFAPSDGPQVSVTVYTRLGA